MPLPLLRSALALLGLLVLSGCRSSLSFEPRLPDRAEYRVSSFSMYSSKLEEEQEVPGSRFQGEWRFTFEKGSAGNRLERRVLDFKPEGYLKSALFRELEKVVDIDLLLDDNLQVREIRGYDSLEKVLRRVEQKKPAWSEELVRSMDRPRLEAEMRDRFRLLRALPAGELRPSTRLPHEALARSLETLQLDSVVFTGPRSRLKKDCLEFVAFYTRTDSLGLLVEQFRFSKRSHARWRKASYAPAPFKGRRELSVDRETGLPCYESATEIAAVTLQDTVEREEVPVQLIRFQEDVYSY